MADKVEWDDGCHDEVDEGRAVVEAESTSVVLTVSTVEDALSVSVVDTLTPVSESVLRRVSAARARGGEGATHVVSVTSELVVVEMLGVTSIPDQRCGVCNSRAGDRRGGHLGGSGRGQPRCPSAATDATYDSVPLEMTVELRLSVGRDEAPEIGGDCVTEGVAELVIAVVVSTCGAAAAVPARAKATRSTRERALKAMVWGLYNTDVQVGGRRAMVRGDGGQDGRARSYIR